MEDRHRFNTKAWPSTPKGSWSPSSRMLTTLIVPRRRCGRRGSPMLYFGYARDGRSALWVHVPDEANANRAIRCLADHQVLHIRHYGHGSQDDLHIR
jgi:hypothetical protein